MRCDSIALDSCIQCHRLRCLYNATENWKVQQVEGENIESKKACNNKFCQIDAYSIETKMFPADLPFCCSWKCKCNFIACLYHFCFIHQQKISLQIKHKRVPIVGLLHYSTINGFCLQKAFTGWLLEFNLKLTIVCSPFRLLLGKVHTEIEFSMHKDWKGANRTKGLNIYFSNTCTVERLKQINLRNLLDSNMKNVAVTVSGLCGFVC